MYQYCGPYWSAGKRQASVVSEVPPDNDLDRLCMEHDASYARGEDLLDADMLFASRAVSHGPLGMGMGALVGAQALLRAADSYIRPTNNMTKTQSQKLRGSQNNNTQPKTKQGKSSTGSPMTGNDTVRAAPVAFATRRTGSKPKMGTKAGGVVTISHRSFLTPINNSIAYTATQVACNPGLLGSFPWLSSLASKYEMYRFTRLRYEFRSVTASSTTGVVMMSFDYDAADEAPASKAEQAQTIPNSETNVWMNNDLVVPCGPEWRYVRQSALASNLDIKTYDMGNLWLSTAYGNGAVGGELYVEYTVELKKPSAGYTPSGLFSCLTSAFAAPINLTSNTTSGIGYPFVRSSNTELLALAGGEWLVVAEADGTGLSAGFATPTIISTGVGTAVQLVNRTFSATLSIAVFKVRINSSDLLVFANAGAGATISATRVRASPISYTSY